MENKRKANKEIRGFIILIIYLVVSGLEVIVFGPRLAVEGMINNTYSINLVLYIAFTVLLTLLLFDKSVIHVIVELKESMLNTKFKLCIFLGVYILLCPMVLYVIYFSVQSWKAFVPINAGMIKILLLATVYLLVRNKEEENINAR